MPGKSKSARRLEELTTIYSWIDANDDIEKDFIILGDMNIEDCDELQDALPAGYVSLNDQCLTTNTNVNGPKPYDHVIHKGLSEVHSTFEVVDLIEAMRVPWGLTSTGTYPGDPYDHNSFRVRYSDHHPIQFSISSTADDD